MNMSALTLIVTLFAFTVLIILCWRFLQQNLREHMVELDRQLKDTLTRTRQELTEKVDEFSVKTEYRLNTISGLVEQRLQHGFEKTNETFVDIVKRLTIIDEAQKKISELSTSVVSLQEILADKRARGAFGEVQLHTLIKNVLPDNAYALQHTLSNGTRADCVLFLPEPSGSIVIDSKFPLEDYQTSLRPDIDEVQRRVAQKQFAIAVKKHITDIAEKYILPGETSDGAVMFIPAEAVFSEIHARYPEIVALGHRLRVWLTSPTTMMAVLTTAHSVLKDAATRKQVHVIQEHLRYLGDDFSRFEKRMDNLSKHLQQANQDAEQVHISAKRITSRFSKIEKVELPPITKTAIPAVHAKLDEDSVI
jgi:DNA recombination protein RmuC